MQQQTTSCSHRFFARVVKQSDGDTTGAVSVLWYLRYVRYAV